MSPWASTSLVLRKWQYSISNRYRRGRVVISDCEGQVAGPRHGLEGLGFGSLKGWEPYGRGSGSSMGISRGVAPPRQRNLPVVTPGHRGLFVPFFVAPLDNVGIRRSVYGLFRGLPCVPEGLFPPCCSAGKIPQGLSTFPSCPVCANFLHGIFPCSKEEKNHLHFGNRRNRHSRRPGPSHSAAMAGNN